MIRNAIALQIRDFLKKNPFKIKDNFLKRSERGRRPNERSVTFFRKLSCNLTRFFTFLIIFQSISTVIIMKPEMRHFWLFSTKLILWRCSVYFSSNFLVDDTEEWLSKKSCVSCGGDSLAKQVNCSLTILWPKSPILVGAHAINAVQRCSDAS